MEQRLALRLVPLEPAHLPVIAGWFASDEETRNRLGGFEPLEKSLLTPDPHRQRWVAQDPETGGTVGLGIIGHEHGGDGNLVLLVNPTWRGRGFGHTLLRHLIAQARRDGISGFIYVEVEADHEAMLRLLTRAGFGPDPADPRPSWGFQALRLAPKEADYDPAGP